MKRILLIVCLLLIAPCRAAEPLRFVVSPDHKTWSLQERGSQGWQPLLDRGAPRATLADGRAIAFTGVSIAQDGRSLTFRARDLTIKLIARWLPASKLPATATLLPIAYAKRPGLALRDFSAAAGATAPSPGGAPVVLSIGRHGGLPSAVRPLPEGQPVASWWVTALHGPSQSVVFGYASSVQGKNSFTVERAANRVTITDSSVYGRLPIPQTGEGTPLDALYLSRGSRPSDMLAQYAAATRVFTGVMDPAPGLTSQPAPVIWGCSALSSYGPSEDSVLASAEAVAHDYGTQRLRAIMLNGGYQTTSGDWNTNARFPHGHRWLTDHLHALGFQAGLRLSPFCVSEASGIYKAHPDWLLRRPGGAPVTLTREPGENLLALDISQPAVRTWLLELFRRITREWGYDIVQLDELSAPLDTDAAPIGPLPPVAAYRAAMKAIREGCAPKTYLIASNGPFGPTVGLVNANGTGPESAVDWPGVQDATRNAAACQWMHDAWWQNLPAAIVPGGALDNSRLRTWAAVIALCGDPATILGDPATMDDANKATVRSLMPAAARGARIADLWSGSPEPPAVWILPALLSPARITVVGLFNWTEAPRTTELDPVTLGIAGKGDRVHVWDLTAMRYLGGSATGIEMLAGAVRLMAVAPDVTHPQLLGTDAHVTSGAWDVSGVQWLSKYKALKGAGRATPGVLFRIAVTEPKGYAFQNVEATGAAIERLPSESGSLLFRITPDRSNVGWVVRYR